jgi:hypothetical protein
MNNVVVILIDFAWIFPILLFAGSIILQIHLSKKENRSLGMILPGIYLAISVLIVLVFLLNTSTSTSSTVSSLSNSSVASTSTSTSASIGPTLVSCLVVFIVCNIPTAILLIIYNVIRRGRKNNMEIDKMNIQDLS